MNAFIRTAAAIAFSFLVARTTAYACSCEAACVKTPSPGEIGPLYPATINYTVTFHCTDGTACGCVSTLTDSLVPTAFANTAFPVCFPQMFPYWPISDQAYSLTVTWEQCKAWGQANGDGTYTLTNVVQADGGGDLSPPFSCQTNVICRPPPPPPPPDEGCTATLGYWKNHSSGRRFDPIWNSVGGPGAPFFISGQTYLEVLSNPTETMKYYILGRQYIAAVLNGYAGASAPDNVIAALLFAESFFSSHTPTDTLSPELANALVQNAALLDGYNNGLEGPPHCD